MRFAGDSAREQRLARARRANEQDALGNFCAKGFIALGILQKVDHLLQLVLRLVTTRDVVERHLRLGIHHQPRAAFPKAQDRFAGASQTAAQERPQQQHESDRDDPGQHHL